MAAKKETEHDADQPKGEEAQVEAPAKKCGIIMPISEIDGCSEQHWKDVLRIIKEALHDAGFEGRLVSDADETNVIQKSIVNNVYHDEIIIADISAKNANVMFELGMRIAFDKHAVIIKDDVTSYSFDTGPIKHLVYPRDLHYTKIVEFKALLAATVTATYAAAQEGGSPFLKTFGDFKVATINDQKMPADQALEILLEKVDKIQSQLQTGLQTVSQDTSRLEKVGWVVHNPQTQSRNLFTSELRRLITKELQEKDPETSGE